MRVLIFLFIPFQIYSQINWLNFNTSNSNIPYDKVNSIEFGSSSNSNGNIFIGTAYGLGILNLDNTNFPNSTWNSFFEQTDPNMGLIGNDVINIETNINEDVWVCTTNGISILEYESYLGVIVNEQWSYLNTTNSSMPSNMAPTILFENDGKTWIGTTSGLVVIENNTWDFQTFETEGVFSNNIKKIIQNPSNQNVYIGTLNGGYQVYNNDTFEPFNNTNCGLLDNTINDFIFDNNNNLIITSPFAGLEILTSQESWVIFNSVTSPTLPFFINSLKNIVIDNNNNLWISTMENGLIKYSNNNWFFYNEENSGLPDNQINCLKYDELFNYLWIGTETKGVVMMDLNNINLLDNSKKNTFKPYFSNGYLELNCTENGMLKIYNVSGKLIKKHQINNTIKSIPVSKLNRGVYIVSLQLNNEILNQKIIKNM